MPIALALNRSCLPHLPLGEFIGLANAVGVDAVEMRNDIAGQEFANGMPAVELKARLDDAGLKLASVNALQRFNDWTAERATEARQLIEHASALGAPGVVLCPAHLPGDAWPDAHQHLCRGLTALKPLLADAGLTGYVEPLGMRHSTMKHQAQAVTAVGDSGGWGNFSLCYDTFQHFRCSDPHLFPERVGLIHVSGISRHDLTPEELTESDCGLIFPGDRVGNIPRLRAMIDAGYSGFVSLAPFSPNIQHDRWIAERLQASLDYIAWAAGLRRGDHRPG